jgi:hypothetical protein
MKQVRCTRCGSKELLEESGYVACAYCQSRFALQADDFSIRETVISVVSDVEALLKKCECDPANRRRYTSLILDIDPTNREVAKYLR